MSMSFRSPFNPFFHRVLSALGLHSERAKAEVSKQKTDPAAADGAVGFRSRCHSSRRNGALATGYGGGVGRHIVYTGSDGLRRWGRIGKPRRHAWATL